MTDARTKSRKKLNDYRREQFAANVRSLCQKMQLSLKDAAESTGVDYRLLRRWASRGISKADSRTASQIESFATFFDIEPSYLWYGGAAVGFFKVRSRRFGEKARRLHEAFNSRFPRKRPTYGSAPESKMLERGDDQDKWRQFILLADYFDKKLTKEQTEAADD